MIVLAIIALALIIVAGSVHDSSVWGEDDYPMRRPARVADEGLVKNQRQAYEGTEALRKAVKS